MSTEDLLKQISFVGPITALNFVRDDLLLVGCGYNLQIYHVRDQSATLQRSVRIFSRERIHGIISQPATRNPSTDGTRQPDLSDGADVLIWGGKGIILTRLQELLHKDDFRRQEIRVPDWILHAAFVLFPPSILAAGPEDENLLAVVSVTAHNELISFNMPSSGAEPEFLTLACPERTLLYSASVKVKSTSDGSVMVHVASGTVFGVVQYWSQIWTPSSSLQENTPRTTFFHSKFISHEGSIFGVAISDDLKRIVSCSDDRSVRLWDTSKFQVGASELSPAVDENVTIKEPLSVGWGHNARIWGVKFLELETFDQLNPAHHLVNPRSVSRRDRKFILSWGEDTTSKLWEAEEGSSEMTCLKTWRNIHVGKNVWSLELPPTPRLPLAVATGGADGALSLWQVHLEDFNTGSFSKSGVNEGVHDVPSNSTKGPRTTLKDYCALSSSTFFATLGSGQLFKGTHSKDSKWSLIGKWDQCQNSSILASWRDTGAGLAAIGDKDGKVAVLDSRHWQDEFSKPECEWHKVFNGRIARLLTAMGSNDAPFLLSISFDELDKFTLQRVTANHPAQIDKTWTLRSPDKFIPTSFSMKEVAPAEYICVLGSRYGAVAIWRLDHNTTDTPLESLNVWRRIHGEDAVTSVNIRDITQSVAVVLSTGRDGSFATHKITLQPEVSLTTIHKTWPNLFTTIEGLYVHTIPNERDEAILYGFHGTDMVLWNETKGIEVGVGGFNCGSGNRNFDILFEKDCEGVVQAFFVYTRAQKCHSVLFPTVLRNPQVEPSFHGREVKTVAISPPLADQPTPLRIIATGAEDTVIRLSMLDPAKSKIIPLCLQKLHSTGVCHLEWSPCGGWLFSCGGVEEVYCWKFTLIGVSASGVPEVGLLKEAEIPAAGKDLDLRVLGSSCLEITGWKKILAAFVYSDSSIKVTVYDTVQKRFYVRISGFYKTSCLLHVRLFWAAQRLVLLTAGTDGHVTLWDLTQPYSAILSNLDEESVLRLVTPIWSQQIHQNSVKSLDLQILSDGEALLLTGGDDTALAVSRMDFRDGVKVSAEKVERAHASAVTGVRILLDKRKVVSAGVDQRVKVWDLQMEEGLKITPVGERYVCIPDVADLGYYEDGEGKEGRMVVAGVGMEILGL